MFVVGPESAGAHPGPVCYRKNGYLAVTDANLVLGRVLPSQFPNIFGPNEDQPLDIDGARSAFEALEQLPEAKGRKATELAWGFLQVANEAMCRPIRNLTQMRGYDISTHILACFGGAGPQHACAMAKALGMAEVFVHRYGGTCVPRDDTTLLIHFFTSLCRAGVPFTLTFSFYVSTLAIVIYLCRCALSVRIIASGCCA